MNVQLGEPCSEARPFAFSRRSANDDREILFASEAIYDTISELLSIKPL